MAISAIEQNRFKGSSNPIYLFHEAAQTFGISKTTLTERFNGRKTRQEAHKHEQKLDDAAQEALVEWIKECGRQNIPLHPSAVAAHAKAISGMEIGENWVVRFRKNHPELRAWWATGMEQCRA